jgi:broad specificity phosphatase PhoE
MTIHLARHGQTAFNHEGRFQGHLPVALDATGREQAHALAAAAAEVRLVSLWCSPLARARETADIVAVRIGLDPREDARLVETDTGDWTGRSFADVRAEDPEGFARFQRSDPTFRYPGGESFAEQEARVLAALDDLRARDRDLPALVVTHRGCIRLALTAARGEREREREIPNAKLIELPDPAPGVPRAPR